MCVWDSLEWEWGSECAAGGFVMCEFVGVCGGESLELVWESECEDAACGRIWSDFVGVSLQQVTLW